MLQLILQVWGGAFYLLNKVFFSRAERSTGKVKRRWQISSWVVYLVGLPAWVIIFIFERNWMVASVEAGGVPAMLIGLIVAVRGHGKELKWLDYVARVAVVLGIAYSLYDFGGITTINQVLELGVVVGFLFGTYLLAKQRPVGYLWFMLMNVSNAALMGIQHYPWLMLQQFVSLCFVVDAFRMQRRNAAE